MRKSPLILFNVLVAMHVFTSAVMAQTLPPPMNLRIDALTPSPSAFPSAQNTGVPAGITLAPSGNITVNTPGTVIDARDISGSITINVSNVTVKRSRIRGSAFSMIWIKSGVTSVRVEDCEIDGRGLSGASNSMGVMGPVTVLRSNIYGVENGVTPYSDSLVKDNYIHDLRSPGSPHYDGIQIDGGISNVTIQHNTIDMSEHGQTATVMVDNYFGPISNIAVDNNLLMGGGYTVYSDGQFSGGSITGVAYTNNRMKKGYWGYVYPGSKIATWSGNVDYATGNPVQK